MKPILTTVALVATSIFVAATSYSNLSFGGFVASPNVHEDKIVMAKAAIELKNTFAGKDRISLVTVKSAEIELTSGKNYHFCLTVAENKASFDVKVAVHRNISGQLFLLKWKPNGC